MTPRLVILLALLTTVGCFKVDVPNCAVACATNADCPGDLTCSAAGLCSSGESCTGDVDAAIDAPVDAMVTSCTADTFLSCGGADTATFCNSSGDGTIDVACGAPGCNATAGRCNECVPDEASCTAEGAGGNLITCSSDGLLPVDQETCALGCVLAAGGVPAHCAYLSPIWLPDACDTAGTGDLVINASATMDTNLDATCTGGVLIQAAGPGICVIRYSTISVPSGRLLTVSGNRIPAFVADTDLVINGTIDVSANGSTSGPGGGGITSGTAASSANGGGGAGFKTAGAAGGDATTSGGGSAGGIVLDPLTLNSMVGGPRAASGSLFGGGSGGGGGGGLQLVSCRGTVTMSGVIDAGGGGGGGGGDALADIAIDYYPAGGGGAGGYVIIQGANLNITGSLWANGGGGGAGCSVNDCGGDRGDDATRSTTAGANGGTANGAASGGGGTGGRVGATPTVGILGSSSAGGGGGATGRIQVYYPTGTTPTITPAAASPALEGHRSVPTR